MDHNGDLNPGELYGQFSERAHRSAATSRDAIAEGFFRNMAKSREDLERELLHCAAPRRSKLLRFLPAFIRERFQDVRNGKHPRKRRPPVVVIIDQPSASQVRSGAPAWTAARVAFLAVAVFFVGCVCGIVAPRLLGPELAGWLSGMRGGRGEPPVVSVEGPAGTADFAQGSMLSAEATAGPPGQSDARSEQPAAITVTPSTTKDARPESTPPLDGAGTPRLGATPAGWSLYLCQGVPESESEAWGACCPTGSPAQARADPLRDGACRYADDRHSQAPGVPVDAGASQSTIEPRKGYSPWTK